MGKAERVVAWMPLMFEQDRLRGRVRACRQRLLPKCVCRPGFFRQVGKPPFQVADIDGTQIFDRCTKIHQLSFPPYPVGFGVCRRTFLVAGVPFILSNKVAGSVCPDFNFRFKH
jgi:hypothetical protein